MADNNAPTPSFCKGWPEAKRILEAMVESEKNDPKGKKQVIRRLERAIKIGDEKCPKSAAPTPSNQKDENKSPWPKSEDKGDEPKKNRGDSDL